MSDYTDEDDAPDGITILTPVRGTRHHTMGSSFTYSSYRVVKRPTENAAIRRLYGRDMDFGEPKHPLDLTATHQLKRACALCGARKDDKEFERDKRFPRGLAFFCRSCRDKVRHRKWQERRPKLSIYEN